MPVVNVEVVESLSGVHREQWNALTGDNPFIQYDFLHELHSSGCASRKTGWLPQYLLLWHDDKLAGAMPMYLKTHSSGEYVFDHSWANAFQQHGIPYYPKLVCAVPFSAVTGPRLLACGHEDKVTLARYAIALADALKVSSLHVLFPEASDSVALKEAGFMFREGVQFHWTNSGYESFDAFLGSMNKDKRKKLKQDKRHVAEAGVTFKKMRGSAIQADDLEFFYHCYSTTYESHYSSPYLTPEFFTNIHDEMPDSMLLIVAEQGGRPIASALNFIGARTMYGRYWGTSTFVSGLHFETCYMQSIEYCIEHAIDVFEGGAQGEHKLSRGLSPTSTQSAHWIRDPRFSEAIQRFLISETEGVEQYMDELESHTPFKLQRS